MAVVIEAQELWACNLRLYVAALVFCYYIEEGRYAARSLRQSNHH